MNNFTWKPFSQKQKKVLTWWIPESPVRDADAIICDGSVRAGKTLSMSFSFMLWAMSQFENKNLTLSGKTIESFRRNVFKDLKPALLQEGYKIKEKRSENLARISYGKIKNDFYIFGGKDEGSQDLIQGITSAGAFFDEVALMPESFVNQAVARCSIDGSKIWFNCNPEGPYHWFKTGWIDKLKEKNAFHLHFTMDDNLSLSPAVIERYKRLFSGVFYKRYIEGLWVLAEGIIYDMFREELHCVDELPERFDYYLLSGDYGTGNPTVFLLFGVKGNLIYCIDEYYWDSKIQGRQKTDAEYSKDLKEFIKGRYPRAIAFDPSAASFKLQLQKDGILIVRNANNSVLDGIRATATALGERKLLIYRPRCPNLIKQFGSYTWDPKAQESGEDKPLKRYDHCCDAVRYCINTFFQYLFAFGTHKKPQGW